MGHGPRERHAIAAVASIVASLAAAYATYSASQAQAAQADYARKVAKNQGIAAAEAAKVAEQNQRDQDRRIMAAQRARIGATGAEEDVGSPLLAEMHSAANAELNARRIRWEGETRTSGFRAEEVGQGFAAGNIRRQGYVAAGATVITGLAKAGASLYSGGGGNTGAGYGSGESINYGSGRGYYMP